jgi:histone arginine demethylase JMJD6
MNTMTIDKRSKLSYEDFEKEYLFPRKPVIITDASAAWKASKWTPQWFKERYPDKIVSTDQGEMRVDKFIDAITIDNGTPGPFLREQLLKDVFPDLAEDVLPTPPYILPNWLSDNFAFGAINKRLNHESYVEVNFCGRRLFPYLHIDDLGVHSFITQLYGEKEVIAFSPDQEKYLYRMSGERFSQITDVDNPDLEKYPLFSKAKSFRATLKAGESVFMPCGWWHTTSVPGVSLSTVSSVTNKSNWKELVRYLKETSKRPMLAFFFTLYLRTIGFIKSRIN